MYLESQVKNKAAIKDAIFDYLAEYPDFGETTAQVELTRFVKFLAQRMLKRVDADDCYFVDFLEDMEKLDN